MRLFSPLMLFVTIMSEIRIVTFFVTILVLLRMRGPIVLQQLDQCHCPSSHPRSPAGTFFSSNGLKMFTFITEYWNVSQRLETMMMICVTGISKWSGLTTHFHASSAKISTKPVLKLHKPGGRWGVGRFRDLLNLRSTQTLNMLKKWSNGSEVSEHWWACLSMHELHEADKDSRLYQGHPTSIHIPYMHKKERKGKLKTFEISPQKIIKYQGPPTSIHIPYASYIDGK